MTTIRPDIPSYTPQSSPQPGGSGGMAAAKAFFALVAGQPQATQAGAPPAQSAAVPVAPPPQSAHTTSAEPPKKILRPGSLLDIRV